MKDKNIIELIQIEGDSAISAELLRDQLDDIISSYKSYSKNTDLTDKDITIQVKEGSVIVAILIPIAISVAGALVYDRFIKEYVSIKKLEKELAKGDIHSIVFSNSEEEELVELKVGKLQKEIVISKKTFEDLQKENVSKKKKKLAQRALKEKRTININDKKEIITPDDLREIAEAELISNKLNQSKNIKGADDNAMLMFEGVDNTGKGASYFKKGRYKEIPISSLDCSNLLDDLDLNNDFIPDPKVDRPVIICRIKYEIVTERKKTYCNIKVMEIRRISRPEGAIKQLYLEESSK